MPLFLLVIFGLYSAMHVYAFLKMRSAFAFGTAPGILIGLFMALMVCSPIIVRLLERQGIDLPARILSYIGYGWMGVLFLFFSLSIIMDLIRVAGYAASLALHRDPAIFMPGAKAAFLIPLILALGISVAGFFSALDIRPVRMTLRSPGISGEAGRLRIVQISDVHVGLTVRSDRLKKIAEVIRKAEPDLIVSTGDLVDGQMNSISGLAEILHELQPRYGKYAVTGNHEFYAGLSHALDFTSRAGFTVLRGERVDIPGVISIAGVDDPTGRQMGLHGGKTETELLSGITHDTFVLLLKHRPTLEDGSTGLFDLQLSGHTHGGQIFPFGLLVKIFFPYTAGLYSLADGASLYVSRGTGTWGPPIRVLSPPEVTVIDLVP
ncbi:MAG: metallophosphoesterase [Desulfomonilia bacterium]|jgi:predicted MPP superfamily phosphohydrolase|uniref:Putative metallophosphoesterase n=1 Tax=anaerobic digester metagenome TaxID=1263854 RepID=A0A485LZL1_9ZZZZ|nr:metallophosphoesterase [Pseudomonadota bacterium]HON38707.1 metallophosphoesterase [Deltaproteobacteria bacterium]HRS55838.1 metallophosphoesterase [Desulfomonilia bacterium]HPD20979.1 metallophosphoesterase [Deltaproteobacteria bacterium]HPX17483.1 metallophosphoesterase [Deltaproteobacteria bacterium]